MCQILSPNFWEAHCCKPPSVHQCSTAKASNLFVSWFARRNTESLSLFMSGHLYHIKRYFVEFASSTKTSPPSTQPYLSPAFKSLCEAKVQKPLRLRLSTSL